MELTKDTVKEVLKNAEEQEFPVPFNDLYTWLGYNQKSDAVKTLENNFQRDQDYVVEWTTKKARQGVPPKSSKYYYLTTDCAKGFAMVSRTQRGKMVRQYFIEAEKELRTLREREQEQSYADALITAANALKEHEERIRSLEQAQAEQRQIQEQARKQLSYTPRSNEQPEQISPRKAISKLVREYSVANGLSYKEVWDQLYNQFKYRYSIDIPTRKKNMGRKVTGLEIVEQMGYINDFYSLASQELQ